MGINAAFNRVRACMCMRATVACMHGSLLCFRLPLSAALRYVSVEVASECEVSIHIQVKLQTDLASR